MEVEERLYDLVAFLEGVYKICKTLANTENGVQDLGGSNAPLGIQQQLP